MSPKRFRLGPVTCTSHSTDDLVAEVAELLASPLLQPRTIACVNAHIANLAWASAPLADALDQCRVVAADGMSIVWASRFMGEHVAERCNMTEAFRAFVNSASTPPCRACLIGGTAEEAEAASAAVNATGSAVSVVAYASGYLTEDSYRRFLRGNGPFDMVLLGLGTPKSEAMLGVVASELPSAVVWHIGGGTILFLSGRLQEAPRWMRRCGMQWVHRLVLEPRRMWRRYLVGNVAFVMRILALRLKRGKC